MVLISWWVRLRVFNIFIRKCSFVFLFTHLSSCLSLVWFYIGFLCVCVSGCVLDISLLSDIYVAKYQNSLSLFYLFSLVNRVINVAVFFYYALESLRNLSLTQYCKDMCSYIFALSFSFIFKLLIYLVLIWIWYELRNCLHFYTQVFNVYNTTYPCALSCFINPEIIWTVAL